MKTLPILAVALLGVAFATAGCDTRGADGERASPQSLILRDPPPPQPVLRKLLEAPWTVPYQGVRRVDQAWRVGANSYGTSYREQVSADGHGQFAIDLLDLLDPPSSGLEQRTFSELQKAREGFLYRYRDFHIHDESRFARHYAVIFSGAFVQVAGRTCDELLIQRREAAPILYTLHVDRETGLVLRCRQELPDGTLIGLMEFESVDYDPVLQQVEWHQDASDEALLAGGTRVLQQLGFTPNLPSSDNAKFTLLGATKVTSPDPAGGAPLAWAKYALTDGVEVVFFLDGGPDPLANGDDVMRLSPSVGPWNHVEGTLHGERLMGLGRVSVDELLDLLEAVF